MELNDALIEWSKTLYEYHLPRWEELPSFELYVDQVLTLIEGYARPLYDHDENILTQAMINNYAKLKLTPKAEKKRYGKKHLAYLIAISILKQVFSISEIKMGIEYEADIVGLKEAYNLFCDELEIALRHTAMHIEKNSEFFPSENITKENRAVKFATASLVSKVVVKKMIALQKQNGNH